MHEKEEEECKNKTQKQQKHTVFVVLNLNNTFTRELLMGFVMQSFPKAQAPLNLSLYRTLKVCWLYSRTDTRGKEWAFY